MYLQKLQSSRNQHEVKAHQWITENKERFSGEVYGPIGMELQVKDAAVAAMLEKYIGEKLGAIVVSTKQDEVLLREKLIKEQRLVLNIYRIDHIDVFRSPYTPDFLATIPFIKGHLCDEVQMPVLVRQFLCNFVFLHMVLWAKGPELSTHLTDEQLQVFCQKSREYKLYVADTDAAGSVHKVVQYGGKKSRYDTQSKAVITSISVEPAKLLSNSSGDSNERKAELDAAIAASRQEIADTNARITTLNNSNAQRQDFMARLTHDIQTLRKKGSDIATLRQQISHAQRKLAEVTKKLSVDANVEKSGLMTRLAAAIDDMILQVDNLYKRTAFVSDAAIQHVYAHAKLKILQKQEYLLTHRLREARQTLQVLTLEKRAKERARDEAQARNQAAEDALLQLQTEYGSEAAFDEAYLKATAQCPEESYADLVVRMEQLNGELDASIDNPQVLERFDELTAALKEADVKYKLAITTFENSQDNIRARSDRWVASVHTIVKKMSAMFSHFMKEIHYGGEIGLNEKGNFCDYEMVLKVSFRQTDSLEQLSGKRHSGGERAVSTIMYLMALQELTSAPFRVVDEINQGMDERNERLVFDRIVRSCCRAPGEISQKPQYFLVSPKLLPGLRALDNDDVTVLMVWNGPGVASKWHMDEVLEAYRKRKADEMVCSSKRRR